VLDEFLGREFPFPASITIVDNVSTDGTSDEPSVSSDADGQPRRGGIESGDHTDELVASVRELTGAIRELVARSPVSSEELLTAEQLAELFRMSPRTLRDLAASGHIPHHRIGKHYRFGRDDIAEILQLTRQVPRVRRARPRTA
jgi:excisionase family DNA binding protein